MPKFLLVQKLVCIVWQVVSLRPNYVFMAHFTEVCIYLWAMLLYGISLLQDDSSQLSLAWPGLVSPETTLQSSDLIREEQWPFVWVISKICDGSRVDPTFNPVFVLTC